MTLPLVVYPDASEGFPDAHATKALQRFQGVARVKTFAGVPADENAWLERIADATGILLGWGLPDRVLREAPALKCIAFTGIGAGKFVNLALAEERGIQVTNTPGYANVTVAEHVMAALLALTRRIPVLNADTHAGGWNQNLPAMDLNGLTIGLVGFGGIAQRVATLAQAFGMRVLVWTRTPARYAKPGLQIEFVEMPTLLAGADVVSLHVAHTPQTEGLLGREELRQMRPGALLINTARGEVLDESALVDALTDGHLGGAALDVFHQEPLPPGGPLAALDNVVLTPHVAYNTPGASQRLLEISIDNLLGWFEGTPRNVVT